MKIKEIFCWALFVVSVLMACMSFFTSPWRNVVAALYWCMVATYWGFGLWEIVGD